MQDTHTLGGPRPFTHDEIEQMYRASLRVLDEVGHSPFIEDPAGFLRIVAGFIAQEKI